MAVITTHTYQFLLELYRKEHDLENDDIRIILMDDTFAFDPTTHTTYSNVSAGEIANGNGYIVGGQLLTNVTAEIDMVNTRVLVTADQAQWTATDGAIPLKGSAIVYNDSHVNKTVILCIDFGIDYLTAEGSPFQISFVNGLSQAFISLPEPL